ncbi:MAG: 16S rRNA (cytidine(1402)-2'-O)-methyltransferase [Rhizobacter sp.]
MSLSPVLLQAAAAAAGGQHFPSGTLYVVATPIGNLADLTLRAIHVLSLVDAVACEDTRHSASLLQHLGLHKPLLALHQHNEREASNTVISRLAQGERVAYVSDAGTPAISDPGAVLVAQVQAAGYRALPIPGASSAVAAMSVAGSLDANEGDHGAGFSFQGFLSSKAAARTAQLKRLATQTQAQVLFEAPHRIGALCASIAAECGARRVTLCRELTKQFETVVTLAASELPGWLAADPHRERGEFVLVLHALPATAHDQQADTASDRVLLALMAELPLKQAVSIAATLTLAPRNSLYTRALQLKQGQGDD